MDPSGVGAKEVDDLDVTVDEDMDVLQMLLGECIEEVVNRVQHASRDEFITDHLDAAAPGGQDHQQGATPVKVSPVLGPVTSPAGGAPGDKKEGEAEGEGGAAAVEAKVEVTEAMRQQLIDELDREAKRPDFSCSVCEKSAHCFICNLSFSSEVQHQEHNQGRKHNLMINQFLESGETHVPSVEKPFVCTVCARNFYCSVCQKPFCSEMQMEDHLKGRKHLKLVAKLQALNQLPQQRDPKVLALESKRAAAASGKGVRPGGVVGARAGAGSSSGSRSTTSGGPKPASVPPPAWGGASGRPTAAAVVAGASTRGINKNKSLRASANAPPFTPKLSAAPAPAGPPTIAAAATGDSGAASGGDSDLFCAACHTQLLNQKQKQEHDRTRKHIQMQQQYDENMEYLRQLQAQEQKKQQQQQQQQQRQKHLRPSRKQSSADQVDGAAATAAGDSDKKGVNIEGGVARPRSNTEEWYAGTGSPNIFASPFAYPTREGHHPQTMSPSNYFVPMFYPPPYPASPPHVEPHPQPSPPQGGPFFSVPVGPPMPPLASWSPPMPQHSKSWSAVASRKRPIVDKEDEKEGGGEEEEEGDDDDDDGGDDGKN